MTINQPEKDSQAAHKQSLFDLHSRYGDVVDVDDVLSHFSDVAPQFGR